MYIQRIILYGSPAAQSKAQNLLQNLVEVQREDCLAGGAEIRLILNKPLKETSLISLLRPSGIQGFRLVHTKD